MCYRYQTGALTPIIRWLSQGMHRAAAPPPPPRPAARADNVPAARQGVDNAAPAGMISLHFMCMILRVLVLGNIHDRADAIYDVNWEVFVS